MIMNDEQLKQWRIEFSKALAEVDRLKAEYEKEKQAEHDAEIHIATHYMK
jgi:hypothetical protein